MIWFVKLRKKLRELNMAKRKKMKGRSARHGKAQSTYQKYQKKPHRYSSDYYAWFHKTKANAASRNKYAEEAKQGRRA